MGITADDVEHTMKEVSDLIWSLNIDQQDREFIVQRAMEKLDIWRTALQPE